MSKLVTRPCFRAVGQKYTQNGKHLKHPKIRNQVNVWQARQGLGGLSGLSLIFGFLCRLDYVDHHVTVTVNISINARAVGTSRT